MEKINEEYKYSYKVVVDKFSEYDYYAYENGILISTEPEDSYRAALRKYILPRLITVVKEQNETCAIGHLPKVINRDNIDEFLKEYYYEDICNRYTKEAYQIHMLIDNFNQLKGAIYGTRINPHDIRVSKGFDYTFQELYETFETPDPKICNKFLNYSTYGGYTLYKPCYFINGVPIEMLSQYERLFYNGLVIGDKYVDKRYYGDHVDLMVDLIYSDDPAFVPPIYDIISDFDKQPIHFVGDMSLEEKIKTRLRFKKRSY